MLRVFKEPKKDGLTLTNTPTRLVSRVRKIGSSLILLLDPGAHERWTGPQIMKQLPSVNVFAASMGTSGQ
jgi:cysteine synthase